ncbi:hypothetical protein CFOL_v3_26620 [Cephalotus follicularis]|uniref:Uncharacterized protein n=1 Tax=Cephalotus follicularis TaxID=3775 RepID=A0A1Q3CSE6_CEPFO|nr:hypothetical protein CFOL_v3_26620 [Cephalotus follicularis]
MAVLVEIPFSPMILIGDLSLCLPPKSSLVGSTRLVRDNRVEEEVNASPTPTEVRIQSPGTNEVDLSYLGSIELIIWRKGRPRSECLIGPHFLPHNPQGSVK